VKRIALFFWSLRLSRTLRVLLPLLAAMPVLAAPRDKLVLPQFARRGDRVDVIAPTPRPRIEAMSAPTPASEPGIDLSHALPGKDLAKLPSSAQQLKSLTASLKDGAPELASAKQKSDTLAAEAAGLRQKLIETAARIESLERQAIADAAEVERLTAEDARLSAGFARDRVAVTRLLAVLERLQHDMPPALAMRPDDALGAARGAMLVGASLPPLYAQAAALSRRIDALKRTRAALVARRLDAEATAARLAHARTEMDTLLAQKEKEAEGAASDYGILRSRLDTIARQAKDFEALLARIADLRQAGGGAAERNIVTVMASNTGGEVQLSKGSLMVPVVGTLVGGGQTPGLTFATRGNAQVIAPADGKVLFAGPYHKSGQVLILEITTGYDLVLAGLGRVTVKPNDQLLAGEPVGNMPGGNVPDAGGESDNRLYFELRRNGHGLNPSPWMSVELRKASRT
jgi:septal ring factor EnvC (AmiA/AmiB activator)